MTVCIGQLTAARGSKLSHLHECNALITKWRLTVRVGYVVCSGHPPPVAAISYIYGRVTAPVCEVQKKQRI